MTRRFKDIDYALLIVVTIIFIAGIFFLFSASYQKSKEIDENLTLKQIMWMIVALGTGTVILLIDYNRLISSAYLIYGLSILSLFIVLGFERVLGAKRWIQIGNFSFQPSEFVKVAIILALARYLGYNSGRMERWTSLIMPIILTIVPVALIIVQPDLGTAILLIPVLFSMLYVSGAKVRHLFALVLTGLAAFPFMWHYLLKGYQKNRLLVFLDPNIDPTGAGYTITQSKIAIGSGGLLGKGWLSGTQNQLNFLPERHTDFIFSVVGEEWGYLGCMMIVLLYLFLIIRGIKIASSTADASAKLLVAGLVTLLSLQIFINIGMTIGLMPVVGLPLPLISYGGSSLVCTMAIIALFINVRMRRMIF